MYLVMVGMLRILKAQFINHIDVLQGLIEHHHAIVIMAEVVTSMTYQNASIFL